VAHDVAQQVAERHGVPGADAARLVELDGVVAKVRQAQRLLEQPAVRVRVGAHAARALRRQREQRGRGRPVRVEELLGPIAPHPVLEHLEVRGVRLHVRHRHLMRAPEALDLVPVDGCRRGPPLRRA